MLTIKDPSKGLVAHGISACHGCGLELVGRVYVDTVGKNSVICIPPGCGALFSGYANETSVQIPGFQGNLEATAAYAAGVKAGFEIQGKGDINVVALAGDGATVDIGLQSLSGMLERGDKVLYLCYDNEAYMNTGIQSSSSTPLYAWTTTTPAGKPVRRKDLMQIVMAHGIPYAATASVADVADLKRKIKKALEATKTGPAFLHVHAPCPTGWGYPAEKTIELARKAISTKCWNLFEVFDGEKIVIKEVKNPEPVEAYLSMQKRFRTLDKASIATVQAEVDRLYELLLKRAALSQEG